MSEARELPNAEEILKKLPTAYELVRLVYHYPSYTREHRTGILTGFFSHKSIDMILDRKFKIQKIDRDLLTPEQINGHKGWAHKRIKYTLIRLLYLRYLEDENLKKHVARARVHQRHVRPIMGHDLSRSRLNEITFSANI